jgi:hypothetical protein
MENEATQNLRDFIRSLVDSITVPFIRKITLFEKKFETICDALTAERIEIKELVTYIKQYELVKEQEIQNLVEKMTFLESTIDQETKKQ